MPFNPELETTRADYDMAIALGYDWVRRVHDGEDVPISEYTLVADPFTVTDDGRHIIVREVSADRRGFSRMMRDGRRFIHRIRLVPNPKEAAHG